jgi:2-haloacid dehalogenase
MANAAFASIDACVFDAYGTLFDVHSAVARAGQRLGDQAQAVSATWRQKQLEYTWLRSLMGAHVDFWQITADGLDYALEAHGAALPDLRESLLRAYLTLDAYPEVADALGSLKAMGKTLAILSNGAPGMLRAAVDGAGLAGVLDAVLSVEEVGIFKPSARVYRLAVDRLRTSAERICFVSSNAWDAAGAAHFGFRVAWVNRFAQRPERLPGIPAAEIRTLAGLPPLLAPA